MPKGKSKDRVMAAATRTVNVVECQSCKRMHPVDSEDFVVIYGNISVGLEVREVVGGNIDDNGKVSGSAIYCRRRECLERVFSRILAPAKG